MTTQTIYDVDGHVIYTGEHETMAEAAEHCVNRGISLCSARLRRADLRGTDLHGLDLRGTDFRRADLRGVDLRDTDLHDTDLHDTDLRDTDLRGADLRGAAIRGALITGADIRYVTGPYACGRLVARKIGSYRVVICDDQLAIGCQQHSIDEWRTMTDEQIADINARYARRYRASIEAFVDEYRNETI